MHIKIISIANKMPDWVLQGSAFYQHRLPKEWQLEVKEMIAMKRLKNTSRKQAIKDEGGRMLNLIPRDSYVVALDAAGISLSTPDLAEKLESWQLLGQDIIFLIGGADGLAADCLARANLTVSLSKLIYPHALVRVIILEQLYRAWSINNNHPYHKGH